MVFHLKVAGKKPGLADIRFGCIIPRGAAFACICMPGIPCIAGIPGIPEIPATPGPMPGPRAAAFASMGPGMGEAIVGCCAAAATGDGGTAPIRPPIIGMLGCVGGIMFSNEPNPDGQTNPRHE